MKTSWIGVFITTCCLLLGLSLGQVQAADYEEVIYYHNDALGSPIAATDANGDVLWTEEYTPYGSRLTYESRETDCSPSPCQPIESLWDEKQWYTGKFEETTLGINYFGARWYEPEIGRFLSQDPAGFSENNIFSFNRYAYANNNPYKYVDPDGRSSKIATLVRLAGSSVKKLGRLSKEQAVRVRQQGGNIVGDTKQAARQIEKAAAGDKKILRHQGHKLQDGSVGGPHYQTEGLKGHSFWGDIGSSLITVGIGLDYLANGIEAVDPLNYLTSGDRYIDKNGNEVGWKEFSQSINKKNRSKNENNNSSKKVESDK